MDNQTCWESWPDLGYPCSVGFWVTQWSVSTDSSNSELTLMPGTRADTEDELSCPGPYTGDWMVLLHREWNQMTRKHTPMQKKYKDKLSDQFHISREIREYTVFFKGWFVSLNHFSLKWKHDCWMWKCRRGHEKQIKNWTKWNK